MENWRQFVFNFMITNCQIVYYRCFPQIYVSVRLLTIISIYTLSDLGVLSNLIGSLSLAN